MERLYYKAEISSSFYSLVPFPVQRANVGQTKIFKGKVIAVRVFRIRHAFPFR